HAFRAAGRDVDLDRLEALAAGVGADLVAARLDPLDDELEGLGVDAVAAAAFPLLDVPELEEHEPRRLLQVGGQHDGPLRHDAVETRPPANGRAASAPEEDSRPSAPTTGVPSRSRSTRPATRPVSRSNRSSRTSSGASSISCSASRPNMNAPARPCRATVTVV